MAQAWHGPTLTDDTLHLRPLALIAPLLQLALCKVEGSGLAMGLVYTAVGRPFESCGTALAGIIDLPHVVQEARREFGDLFAYEPQRRHFAEYLTGLYVAARKTV